MARPEGFEPPTPGSEVPCSILLSYGRTILVAVKSLAQHQLPCNPFREQGDRHWTRLSVKFVGRKKFQRGKSRIANHAFQEVARDEKQVA
jgi:hypothetical protein